MAIPFSRTPPASVTPLWHAQCQTTKSGPIPNLHNVLLALRLDPFWAGKFRYDEMLCSVVMPVAPIEDINVFHVHEWMQQHGLRRVGLDPVREALEIVGREHRFHPLRDWLSSLEWDEELRLADWMHVYLGAPDTEAVKAFSAMFLVAMVARIFQPGCQADYMPVLEGPQGILKSQACRVLAGTYFSDTLPDLSADYVRISMHLRGKWLIEVSELSAFNKTEATKLKAFLTTQVEQYTPKFAHREVAEPRQCVFVGTTNDDAYLRDATGGRRFWPVACGQIDLDGLRRDREQLFAEAVHAYRQGTQWWPDAKFEADYIKPVQETRLEADAWERPVSEFLKGKTETTLHDVAFMGLGLPNSVIRTSEARRIAALLRLAGWKQVSTGRARIWKI